MKQKKNIIAIIAIILLLLIGAIVALFFTKGGRGLLNKIASSDTFNQGEYILPDYDIDGVLDEEIWEKAPCIKYGNSEATGEEVTFRYYYGERGVTAAFVVEDPTICYASNAFEPQTVYRLSDSVYLYLDIKNDGQITPQTDDIKINIAADGRLAIARGSGADWLFTNESIDYQVVVDGSLNKSDGGEQDKSWTAELFIPYETFGIDKEAVMGLMLEWRDSNSPSIEGERYIWYDGGNGATLLPELFHPIDKNGLAFAAPDKWVPAMGRFVSDDTNQLVADDIRALAFYTGETLENGAGTVEATFDIREAKDFFKVSRFSGLLLGVEEVNETELPKWEGKNQYGVFISNSETNPQLVVSSIRVDEDGKVDYKQIAGGNILDILPDFVENKICTVKVAKNEGWMELYIKDDAGEYQHLFDVYDIEPINGNYIGIRTAVKGFAVRDIKISNEAPEAPNPYTGSDVKIYNGLLQKLNVNEFLAKTAGTKATFGTLINKYNVKSLKTITTSLTFPERPSKAEDKIKGFYLNYNPDDQSYLIFDYRHGESNGKQWDDDWRVYIRQRKTDGWGEVAFVMAAEANTKYDFRITPMENKDGATEVYVEYKKATDTEWQSTYCQNAAWVMSGSEYGVETATGNMTFGAMKQVDLGYTRLDESRYNTLQGMFFGRKDGGAQVMAKQSMVIDKGVNLAKQDSYVIKTSFNIVPDQAASIKGIVFNYDEKTGSYLVLDYRYVKEAYRLYVRQFDGTKWDKTVGYDVQLTENAWYDFNIHVVNSKNKTTVLVESKTGSETYRAECRTFDVAMPGRQVGYTSSVANGMQFGEITVGTTTLVGAGDSHYQYVSESGRPEKHGAFFRTNNGVQVATSSAAMQSFMIDKSIDLSAKDSYQIKASYKIVPDKEGTIKGLVFNYDEKTGGYMVLDYRYVKDAYRLYVRQFDGTKWDGFLGYDVILIENATYDFNIHVINGDNSTTIIVESKTGDESYRTESRTLDMPMEGRQVGYMSSAANGLHFGKITTANTTFIGAEDARYQYVSESGRPEKHGAFFRTNNGVQVATSSAAMQSFMIDKSIDLSAKSSYQIETSYTIVPDKSSSIKGIVFNYDEANGSYMVLDYRYVLGAYRLYVRVYNGTSWSDTWPCGVILQENALYNFKLNVSHQATRTIVNVLYKTGTDDYQRVSYTFAYAMSGRGVGYISTVANGMQFGLIQEIKSNEIGFPWPDDWKDALKHLLK